jgi:hypothetical protein
MGTEQDIDRCLRICRSLRHSNFHIAMVEAMFLSLSDDFVERAAANYWFRKTAR